jgi:hypothetical protein
MRPGRVQDDNFLLHLQGWNREEVDKFYKKLDALRRSIEGEKLDPTPVVLRGLAFNGDVRVVAVPRAVFEMGVHKRNRASMIISVMGVIERSRHQRQQHGGHTNKNP